MKTKIDDNELEAVNGGLIDEMNDYVELFRKYGLNEQADILKKNSYGKFGKALRAILRELGFTYNLDVFGLKYSNNITSFDGNMVKHEELVTIIDKFLNETVNK